MRLWRYAKARALASVDGFPDFRLYRTLLDHEQLSGEALAELRRVKTRRLVATCLRDVPYFGDLMRQAGLSAETVRGPEDLAVLPLLDKATIRAQGSRLLNRAAPPDSYFPHTTGGSSGTPLDFYRGWDYTCVAAAANMRAFRRMGWRPGDVLAKLWAPHDEPPPQPGALGALRRRVRHWLAAPEIVFSTYDTTPASMKGWLETIEHERPRFFYGYASNFVLFATFLRERGVVLPYVQGIASTALALFPSDRKLLQERFPGARIIDVYGSREMPGIAAECTLGTMHVNADLVHVEFLEAPDEPTKHRLVVTALDNLVFPFIRYDIGDSGSPLTEPCACGLSFPGIKWGYGKILDSFVSPEGRVMTGGFFEDLMYDIVGVHAYQFRQTADGSIVLYVIPSAAYGERTAAHLHTVEARIREDFSRSVGFRIEQTTVIPPTPAGKHQFVVSELRNPGRRAAPTAAAANA